MQQHPEPDSQIPAAREQNVAGHDAVAYSAAPTDRNPGAKETPEDRKRIAAVLSIRYWIASPKENVLIVATSRNILADTLRKVSDPDPDTTAFPASLQEWKHITSDVPTWGMRHFSPERGATDLSDLRRTEGHAISGLTFEIDWKENKARLTFLGCSPKTMHWAENSVLNIDSEASFRIKPRSTLVANLGCWEKSLQDAPKVESRLAFWLLTHLGHAVII